MRHMTLRLLALAAAFLLLGFIPREEPTLISQPELEGTWQLLTYTRNGSTMKFTGYTWNFSKGKFEVKHHGQLSGAISPYNVDTSTTPARIGWSSCHGIYAIDGDTMKMCFASTTDQRPASFQPAKDQWLYTLQRLSSGSVGK